MTEATGQELWRTDGTEAGTWLVREIITGERDGDPNEFIPMEDQLFFTARDSSDVTQLWRSDGTPEGTLPLTNSIYSVGEPVPVDGGVAFIVGDRANVRLWFSDGTISGTRPISEPFPGTVARRSNMIRHGDSVVFSLTSDSKEVTLWKSDLTASGTVAVKSIRPDRPPSNLAPVTAALDRVFFHAFGNSGESIELWVSDGTDEGTLPLAVGGFAFDNFVALADRLLFPCVGEFGVELCATDGTKDGTGLVKDIFPGRSGSRLEFAPHGIVEPYALFHATDAGHGTELWRTDGTAVGTTLVKDISPGETDTSFRFGPVLGGELLFAANDKMRGLELWKSDATESGTTLVADIFEGESGSDVSFLGVVGTKAAFAARDASHGTELWCTDGTTAGTYLVRDLRNGNDSSGPSNGAIHQGSLYFQADGGAGRELWVSDCTPSGTKEVANLAADFRGPQPRGFVGADSWLVFSAQQAPSYESLWKTDGTEVGTLPLGLWADSLATLGDVVIARSSMRDYGAELWKYDLNSDEMGLVRDIAPRGASSNPSFLKRSGDLVYFGASDSTLGTEPWRTDGSDAGTVLLKDIAPARGSSQPMAFAWTGTGAKTLFISASLGELWITEGTPSTTQRVVGQDVVRPSTGEFERSGNRLFFVGSTAASGPELWRTDGTAAGTVLVADLFPGRDGTQFSELTDARGQLYFAADRGLEGSEPWRSDGTPAGTELLKDIRPGIVPGYLGDRQASSEPREFTPVGSIVVFSADDGVHGRELWRSNGSNSGTVLVKDIEPGPHSSNPASFVRVGSKVYFRACAVSGCELWVTDGTEDGTHLFVDVLPGSLPSNPRDLTHFDTRLFFSAQENTSSRQLWAVEVGAD